MKKISLTATGVIFIIAMMTCVSAIELTSFDADYSISGTQTRTIYSINFIAQNQNNFSIELPGDSQINSISVDDLFVDYAEKKLDTKKTITFNINQSGKTIIDYTTNSYIDSGSKNYFVSDIRSDYPIEKITAKVGLPANSFLSDSKAQGGSVFPQGNIATDGKIIYIEWMKNNLESGNSFPMFVIYKTMKGMSFLIYIITLLILGIVAYFGFPYLVKKHVKNLQEKETEVYSKNFNKTQTNSKLKSNKDVNETKKDTRSENKPDSKSSIEEKESIRELTAQDKQREKHNDLQKILAHLTEDEQQIVNILADREGHIEQGTLVIITGFSKAHLSRLLDELQRRRIIHKEKKGKKNVVWLKSQF